MNPIPSLNTIYDSIESHDLATQANLASSFRFFIRSLTETPAFQQLIDALDSAEVRARIVARVRNLAESNIDERFEHPSDVALAAYLTALAHKDIRHAAIAATAARQARNTWWLAHTLPMVTIDRVFSTDPQEAGSESVHDKRLEAVQTRTVLSPVLQPPLLGKLPLRALHNPYVYPSEPKPAPA